MTGVRRRRAGRVLVVDEANRVLLLRGSDPADPAAGSWWITPGGGIEAGESTQAAARRELAEETGLVHEDDLGPSVYSRVAVFDFDGVTYEQSEDFFLLRTPAFQVDTSRWTDIEMRWMSEPRWWPLEELRTTSEVVYPEELAELLDRLLRQ